MEEKGRCVKALGTVRNVELLSKALNYTLDNEMRTYDIVILIESVAHNAEGTDLAWNLVKQHWSYFDKKFQNGIFLVIRLLKAFCVFTSYEKADEIEAFFKINGNPGIDRSIKQLVEVIRANAKLLTQAENVKKWLNENAQF